MFRRNPHRERQKSDSSGPEGVFWGFMPGVHVLVVVLIGWTLLQDNEPEPFDPTVARSEVFCEAIGGTWTPAAAPVPDQPEGTCA